MSPILCSAFYPSFGADVLIAFLGGILSLTAGYIVFLASIKKTRRDRLKYVVSLIDSIVPSIIRQAQYCIEYASLITSQPFSDGHLRLEANRDPKRLADKVEQEGVYHAFLWMFKRTKETYRAFQQLYGFIDYIDYIVDDMIKTNERILDYTWERKKQYQLGFKQTKQNMQSLSLIAEFQKEQPELIVFCQDLLEKFTEEKTGGENIVQSFNSVIEPLRNYIISNAKTHPKVTELLFLCQDLFNEFHGIELAAEHNASDYKYYATKLEDSATKLTEASASLRMLFNFD